MKINCRYVWVWGLMCLVISGHVFAGSEITLDNFVFVGGAITQRETQTGKGLKQQLIAQLELSELNDDQINALQQAPIWVGLDFFAPPNELLWDEGELNMSLEIEDDSGEISWQVAKPYVQQALTMSYKWKKDDFAHYASTILERSMTQSQAKHVYLGLVPDFLFYATAKKSIEMLRTSGALSDLLQSQDGNNGRVLVDRLSEVTADTFYALKIQPMLTNKIIPGIKQAVKGFADQDKVTVLDANTYAISLTDAKSKDFEAYALQAGFFEGLYQRYGTDELLISQNDDELFDYPIPSEVLEVFTLNMLIDQLNADFELDILYKDLP